MSDINDILKNKAIKNFEHTTIEVPISKNKDGSINYRTVEAYQIFLDWDEDLSFLEDLEFNYIQIDNTFYHKKGYDFVYDYYNQSSDFFENFEPIENHKIYILLEDI